LKSQSNEARLIVLAKLRGITARTSIDDEEASSSSEIDEPLPLVPRQMSYRGVPMRKGTRSNPSKPSRPAKPIDYYVAKPAHCVDRSSHKPWLQTQDKIKTLNSHVKSLDSARKDLRKELCNAHSEMYQLNKKLLAPDQPGDSRPLTHEPPEPFEPADLKKFVKAALNSKHYKIAEVDLIQVLEALGLDTKGRVSKQVSKDSFVQGIRTICDFHFSSYEEVERADVLGELLFNGGIFSKSASEKASEKAARTMTSCIFNAVEILKNMDMRAGSSNDNSMDEYAKIEMHVGLTSPPEGKSMLRPRHNITRARTIANGLVTHLFTINESHSPEVETEYDQVSFDPERLYRFGLDTFKLKEKALLGKNMHAFTGDGAAVCTSTQCAGQTLFGFKIIDGDAINPLTNEPLLCSFIDDDDNPGRRTKKVYHGAQSNVCCMVSSAVMAKEKQAMESESFIKLIDFLKKLESEGLPASGDEPALPPQKNCTVGCGDLSLQQKMSNLGGACKVKEFFCTYCSTQSGDHDLLGYVFGDLICSMCKRNERTRCPHVPVDDLPELKRKGLELMELHLDDKRRMTGNDSLVMKDILPQGLIDCFYGYDNEFEKVMEKVDLRDTVSEDGKSYSRSHLYDYTRHLTHTELSDKVLQKSTIKFDPNAEKKEEKTNNIEYVLGTYTERDDAFILNVTRDLLLRGYKNRDLPLDPLARQDMLLGSLMVQKRVRTITNALTNNEDALAKQIFNPGILACCILHAKMRMIEKFIQQLILAGMRKNPTGAAFTNFCERVEVAVNNDILGRTSINAKTGQWRVPLDKNDQKKLGDVKLSGSAATKFVSGMKHLVSVCTAEYTSAYTTEWILASELMNTVMTKLESKDEFDQDMVDSFQLSADKFCDVYCGITGRDGMTNYFHILRSGHFSYFLAKYKNLYLLSQQGWENVNSRFKRSFHNNSQKGGGKNGSSKLAPVMYTMARDMLWRYGFLDGLFHHLGHTNALDVKYGDVKRIPYITKETNADTKAFAETILRFGSFADVYVDDDYADVLLTEEIEMEDSEGGEEDEI